MARLPVMRILVFFFDSKCCAGVCLGTMLARTHVQRGLSCQQSSTGYDFYHAARLQSRGESWKRMRGSCCCPGCFLARCRTMTFPHVGRVSCKAFLEEANNGTLASSTWQRVARTKHDIQTEINANWKIESSVVLGWSKTLGQTFALEQLPTCLPSTGKYSSVVHVLAARHYGAHLQDAHHAKRHRILEFCVLTDLCRFIVHRSVILRIGAACCAQAESHVVELLSGGSPGTGEWRDCQRVDERA